MIPTTNLTHEMLLSVFSLQFSKVGFKVGFFVASPIGGVFILWGCSSMIRHYYIYRPAGRDYLQYATTDQHGLHTVWGDLIWAAPISSRKRAQQIAEEITAADRVMTQVIVMREEGRSTVDGNG